MTASGVALCGSLLALLLAGCSSGDKPPPPTAPATLPPPAAPASDTSTVLPDNITLRQVQLDRRGVSTRLWIYRPAQREPRLPVILIAAAGTPLIWGMKLSEGDRPEHVPWAKRGYLVVAYSLDGHVDDQRSDQAIVTGIRAFLQAKAGLENAKAALDFALEHEPTADPERVYAVGHSSAATVALRVGAELPRIKAVVAFNGAVDVEARVAAALELLREVEPQAPAVIRASSPLSHVAALRAKPVFLFHAADDSTVPVAESERLAEAMKPAAAASKLLVVPTGGHYDSMLEQGLPAAMAWLDELSKPPRPTRPGSH